MNAIFVFLRQQAFWVLLLGLIQVSDAHYVPEIRLSFSAPSAYSRQPQPKPAPTDDAQPILDLIAKGLQWMPQSHNDQIKSETLYIMAQTLNMLAKQARDPKQKDQIQTLLTQTLQAVSGFAGANVKAFLLSKTVNIAIQPNDVALSQALLAPIEQVASSIDDPVFKAYALGELAQSAATAGDLQTARMLLNQSRQVVSDTITQTLTRYRLDQLQLILGPSTQPRTPLQDSLWVKQTLDQLKAITDEGILTNALARFSHKITQIPDKIQAQQLQDQLFKATHTIQPERIKAQLIDIIAQGSQSMTDSVARRNRLLQLKREAQDLTDGVAQRQALTSIYMARMQAGDRSLDKNELTEALLGGNRLGANANLFQGLSNINGQSPASLRLQVITQILGRMSLVAAQLGDQPMASELTQQTLQVSYGVQMASDFLSSMVTATAKAAAQTSDKRIAQNLLLQANRFVQNIDEVSTQIRALSILARWTVQAGVLANARALLKQSLQQAIQVAFTPPGTGRINFSTLEFTIMTALQVSDTTKARAWLTQVVSLVDSLPDSDAKVYAYTSVITSLHTWTTQQRRLLDAEQMYALLTRALQTIKAGNKIQDKFNVLTNLTKAVEDVNPAHRQPLLTQLLLLTNGMSYPNKGWVLGDIIQVIGNLAKNAIVAGDERQAQALFSQAQQLWTGITEASPKSSSAYTLVEKKAQATVLVKDPTAFQRWLIQLRATVRDVGLSVNTNQSLGIIVHALTDQARQTNNPERTRMLIAQAIKIANEISSPSVKAFPLRSILRAGSGVLGQDQFKVLLKQTLQGLKTKENRNSEARELIALGHIIAQRRPIAEVQGLLDPLLEEVRHTDNPGVKKYILSDLVKVDPRDDRVEPAHVLWQQVMALASTLDDAAAQEQTLKTLKEMQPIADMLSPKGQTPSLETEQKALEAAKPSVRVDVLSAVAESMTYWHALDQATLVLNQVSPIHKVQVINGMLVGWLKQHQPSRP